MTPSYYTVQVKVYKILWLYGSQTLSRALNFSNSVVCVYLTGYLRHPVALRSTCEECRCSLRSSWCGEESQPEWGMITVLVSTARASWIIGIFNASHEDKFHSTPAHSRTQNSRESNMSSAQTTCIPFWKYWNGKAKGFVLAIHWGHLGLRSKDEHETIDK